MLEALLKLIVLVLIGALLRLFKPGHLSVDNLRTALTEMVFFLFLPALVLRVLWLAPLGMQSLKISAIAASGILASMLLSWLICRSCRVRPGVAGAVILAASFGNFTYLGLPVLVATLGDWAASVAIQYDLFASTPLLFTLGIVIAARFGEARTQLHPFAQLMRLPPLWAALLATLLNMTGVPMPEMVSGILELLGAAVIPLMLVALGMSLQARNFSRGNLGSVLVVTVIQLGFMPLVVWLVSSGLQLTPSLQLAVLLEAAMPSMVLGLVLCERYRLDTGVYATAVTVSTLISVFTLPAWYYLFHA